MRGFFPAKIAPDFAPEKLTPPVLENGPAACAPTGAAPADAGGAFISGQPEIKANGKW